MANLEEKYLNYIVRSGNIILPQKFQASTYNYKSDNKEGVLESICVVKKKLEITVKHAHGLCKNFFSIEAIVAI